MSNIGTVKAKCINAKCVFLLCMIYIIVSFIPNKVGRPRLGDHQLANHNITLVNRIFNGILKIITHIDNELSTEELEASEDSKVMACTLPQLDPFDKSIRHLTSIPVEPPMCDLYYKAVFRQTFNNTLVRLKGTKKWKDCCYKVVGRNVTFAGDDTDLPLISESKECYPLTAKVTLIPPEHEYIGVYCRIPSKLERKLPEMYKKRVDSNHRMVVDSFAFTSIKLHVEDRVQVIQRNYPANNPEEQVNLVILGFDSLSHMNFKRTMPEVVEYLLRNLSAIEMNGYDRIGEDTFSNMAAFITNMTEDELEESKCYSKGFTDTCPFLWKDFAAHGYRTSIAEDWPRGEVFAYKWSIVDHPPVDYHLQPLMAYAHTHTSGPKHGLSTICSGPRLSVDYVLDYTRNLAATMGKSKRYFQFSYSGTLTHESLTDGALAESSVLSTLQWFESEGHLNNTVFVMMSDHGSRAGGGDIVNFSQGKVEGNMPLLYFVLPEWFKQKYSRATRNLRINRNRLSTTFDAYATLKDILNPVASIRDDVLKQREIELKQKNYSVRGISLFLPIPTARTCESAEIPVSFCVCRTKVSVNMSSALVENATAAAVQEINQITKDEAQCSELKLYEMISATQDQAAFSETWVFTPQDQVIEMAFTTEPGNARFLAVMTKNSTESGGWTAGSISRTNIYGNQSHCVTDRYLKRYCFCKDLI